MFVCVLSLGCCWLSCQYLPNDQLVRSPLRTPLRGKEIIPTKFRPNSVYDFWFSVLFHTVYCVIVLSTQYISYSYARYSLFVLKVSLNRPTVTKIIAKNSSGSIFTCGVVREKNGRWGRRADTEGVMRFPSGVNK